MYAQFTQRNALVFIISEDWVLWLLMIILGFVMCYIHFLYIAKEYCCLLADFHEQLGRLNLFKRIYVFNMYVSNQMYLGFPIFMYMNFMEIYFFLGFKMYAQLVRTQRICIYIMNVMLWSFSWVITRGVSRWYIHFFHTCTLPKIIVAYI